MRQFLLIFLLVLLPFQFSWTAVANYCQHETETGATSPRHFGHHDHQHKASDGKDAADYANKLGGTDPDCASCHAGSVSLTPSSMTLPPVTSAARVQENVTIRLPPPPFARLERPEWTSLA